MWDAIALHTTPEIPWHKRPEIALVTGGVEADVLGDGLDEIPAGDRDAVLTAYPRIDFKRGIVRAFSDGLSQLASIDEERADYYDGLAVLLFAMIDKAMVEETPAKKTKRRS